ncbi:(Fe-S)-binding protein [Actinotalea sp.]|uniref:(Fe-S)-binding protein n=1 Tax=Actinotalea sp. TaxID=1872145 RepID=UPI00356B3043
MSALQIVALVLALVATAVGVSVFVLGARAIVRTVAVGRPAPDRATEPWRRTWLVLLLLLGHGRFQHRPGVKVAHWAVMLSFPILFLTLVSGYGQIVDPYFVLPLVGHWPPLEWLTEVFAWLSLVGIVLLIVVRQRSHPRRGAAAASRVSAARSTADGSGTGPEGERASRFFGSNRGQAYFVEAVVLGVVLAVLLLRGLESVLASPWRVNLDGGVFDPSLSWGAVDATDPAVLAHFPLTAWIGALLDGISIAGIETAVVLTALAKILLSMTWMYVVGRRPAMGVSWHRFLAVVNVWARRETSGRPALGPLSPVTAGGVPVDLTELEEIPDDLRLGVGAVEDFTWKGLLDFSTCTECGRCQEQCPAWNTGKPLSPKLVVMALRDHAYASAPYLQAAANASTEPAGHTSTTGHVPLGGTGATAGEADSHASVDVLSLVGDVIDPQALWDCTMCGACVQQCPVDIEHIDHLVDLRRNQVLVASTFPAELGTMFTKIEKRGNPWGLPARQRLAWAKDLPFEVPVVGVDVEDASAVDHLFWVGCAGAYDDKAKATTRAVAELMHHAGVSFAVLGDGETCTGDPARRAGNEALFQMLARTNIETFTEAKVRRIVVTCAHCFNTLRREYPQLGGDYEVLHHTELLERLVAEGRLTPVAPTGAADDAGTVTYHDPCYLGRHNEVYAPPRELLRASGARLAEMPRTQERSFCCGGGGARVWMEETTGTRIGSERAAEAVATGADVIATGCPFCTVMLTDGVAAQAEASGSAPAVVDVAQVLLDAVRPRD